MQLKTLRRLSLILALPALMLISVSCSDTSTGSQAPEQQNFDSRQGPGASAHAFLSDSSYDKLVVEIDYMPNQLPTQQARDSLQTFLEHRLNKPGGIVLDISADRITTQGDTSYSNDDIVQLEENYRDQYTEAGSRTLKAYFLFLDGQYSNSKALGVTYFNTSMAFFEKTIRDNSGGFSQPARYKIEATVMNHEFGHTMGLVADGSPMQTNHQDYSHGHHCDNKNCLMYYAVETTDYLSNLMDSQVPDLDANCRADLQANGGK